MRTSFVVKQDQVMTFEGFNDDQFHTLRYFNIIFTEF